MNCGNNFINIYLMVLFIIISIDQCKFEKVANLKDKNYLNPSIFGKEPKNYDTFLKILHLKRRSQALDSKLKHKLDEIILQNNLQLLKDRTKTQLLKIGNTYLENFSHSDTSKTKTSSDNLAEKLNFHSKTQNDIGSFDAKKFLKSRKYSQNSGPHSKKRKSKFINRHKLWKREDDDDEKKSSFTSDESDKVEDPNHKILEEIVEELQDIKDNINMTTHKKGASLLNGTWVSDLVGLSFTIIFHEDVVITTKTTPIPHTTKSPFCLDESPISTVPTTKMTTARNPLKVDKKDACIKIDEVYTDGSVKRQPIVDTTFTITARVPFARDTMLMITGMHPPSKTISVFVGQYKFCEKEELVVGRWIVEKYARHCKQIQINEDVFGDVLRRPTLK